MQNNSPFFSIIIPTYNRAKLLDKCLSSIDAQTYKDFEVIVCDDGSTDNTNEIIEKYKNCFQLLYLWEENWGGPARPRNRGINAANGKWICFLDSDDLFYPDKLEICRKYTDNYDFIYHNVVINKCENKPFLYTSGRDLHRNAFRILMLNDCFIPMNGVCVKKEILLKAGCFSEEDVLKTCAEDLDLWLRIALTNCRFKYMPLYLGECWYGGGNTSNINTLDDKIKREKVFFKKYLNYLNFFDRFFYKAYIDYTFGFCYHEIKNLKKAYYYYLKSFFYGNLKIKIKTLIRLIFGTRTINFRFWQKSKINT